MKLNDLIGNTLNELDKAKKYDSKRNYLVDEVILELSVSSVKSVDGSFEFKIFGVGSETNGQIENESAHKITLKLKPKKRMKIED